MGYEVVSRSIRESSTAVTSNTLMSTDVNTATVHLDDYSVPVMFTVTSLLDGNEICHSSQTSEQ